MAPPLQLCWSSLRIHSGWFRALYAVLLVPRSSIVSSPLWSPLHPKLSFLSFMRGLLRAFTKVSPARVVRPERLWPWRRRSISPSLLHPAPFGWHCQVWLPAWDGPCACNHISSHLYSVAFLELLGLGGSCPDDSPPFFPAQSGPNLKGQLSLIVEASLPAQTLAVILSFPVFFFFLAIFYISFCLVLFHRGPA